MSLYHHHLNFNTHYNLLARGLKETNRRLTTNPSWSKNKVVQNILIFKLVIDLIKNLIKQATKRIYRIFILQQKRVTKSKILYSHLKKVIHNFQSLHSIKIMKITRLSNLRNRQMFRMLKDPW